MRRGTVLIGLSAGSPGRRTGPSARCAPAPVTSRLADQSPITMPAPNEGSGSGRIAETGFAVDPASPVYRRCLDSGILRVRPAGHLDLSAAANPSSGTPTG